jgi:hypothetical protein
MTPVVPVAPVAPAAPAPPVQIAPIVSVPVLPQAMPPSYRLKYARFKGKGQDVNEWLDQFSATLEANDENDPETTKKLVQGLLEGEALRWYNGLLPAARNDWNQLKRAFRTEFRDVGTD